MVTTIRIPSYAGLVWKKFQRFDTAQNMKTDNLLFFGIRPELLMRPKTVCEHIGLRIFTYIFKVNIA